MHSYSYAHQLKKNPLLAKFPIPPSQGEFSLPPPLNAIWEILISDISTGFFGMLLTTQQVVTC